MMSKKGLKGGFFSQIMREQTKNSESFITRTTCHKPLYYKPCENNQIAWFIF